MDCFDDGVGDGGGEACVGEGGADAEGSADDDEDLEVDASAGLGACAAAGEDHQSSREHGGGHWIEDTKAEDHDEQGKDGQGDPCVIVAEGCGGDSFVDEVEVA